MKMRPVFINMRLIEHATFSFYVIQMAAMCLQHGRCKLYLLMNFSDAIEGQRLSFPNND